MAPFKPKRWATSRYLLWTTLTANGFYLKLDIVKYAHNGALPAYNLILGKQTLHNLGVLDFKEKTITIDKIILPMRNINNLQLKTSISRALKLNSSFSQDPART